MCSFLRTRNEIKKEYKDAICARTWVLVFNLFAGEKWFESLTVVLVVFARALIFGENVHGHFLFSVWLKFYFYGQSVLRYLEIFFSNSLFLGVSAHACFIHFIFLFSLEFSVIDCSMGSNLSIDRRLSITVNSVFS